MHHGVKEIDKTDTNLDEIIPENVTVEVETVSATEKSLLKIYCTENFPPFQMQLKNKRKKRKTTKNAEHKIMTMWKFLPTYINYICCAKSAS